MPTRTKNCFRRSDGGYEIPLGLPGKAQVRGLDRRREGSTARSPRLRGLQHDDELMNRSALRSQERQHGQDPAVEVRRLDQAELGEDLCHM